MQTGTGHRAKPEGKDAAARRGLCQRPLFSGWLANQQSRRTGPFLKSAQGPRASRMVASLFGLALRLECASQGCSSPARMEPWAEDTACGG